MPTELLIASLATNARRKKLAYFFAISLSGVHICLSGQLVSYIFKEIFESLPNSDRKSLKYLRSSTLDSHTLSELRLHVYAGTE